MAKKGKLPKRIAGVKIPKKLRKRGGELAVLAQNPMVRNVLADLVAAGLLAAADAISKEPESEEGRESRQACRGGLGPGSGARRGGPCKRPRLCRPRRRSGDQGQVRPLKRPIAEQRESRVRSSATRTSPE